MEELKDGDRLDPHSAHKAPDPINGLPSDDQDKTKKTMEETTTTLEPDIIGAEGVAEAGDAQETNHQIDNSARGQTNHDPLPEIEAQDRAHSITDTMGREKPKEEQPITETDTNKQKRSNDRTDEGSPYPGLDPHRTTPEAEESLSEDNNEPTEPDIVDGHMVPNTVPGERKPIAEFTSPPRARKRHWWMFKRKRKTETTASVTAEAMVEEPDIGTAERTRSPEETGEEASHQVGDDQPKEETDIQKVEEEEKDTNKTNNNDIRLLIMKEGLLGLRWLELTFPPGSDRFVNEYCTELSRRSRWYIQAYRPSPPGPGPEEHPRVIVRIMGGGKLVAHDESTFALEFPSRGIARMFLRYAMIFEAPMGDAPDMRRAIIAPWSEEGYREKLACKGSSMWYFFRKRVLYLSGMGAASIRYSATVEDTVEDTLEDTVKHTVEDTGEDTVEDTYRVGYHYSNPSQAHVV